MPPPQRERYHSSSRPPWRSEPQRYTKKEDSRFAAGKKSSRGAAAPSSFSSSSSSTPAVNVREEALKDALAKALTNPNASAGTSSALGAVDTYGNGSPTDRLQFGYSPAVAAEAVSFHARFAARDWVAARKRNGRVVFVKKQKLSPPNCEPTTAMLKLQRHWKKTNAFHDDVHSGSSKLKAADLDKLLDMLASKQRIGEDE